MASTTSSSPSSTATMSTDPDPHDRKKGAKKSKNGTIDNDDELNDSDSDDSMQESDPETETTNKKAKNEQEKNATKKFNRAEKLKAVSTNINDEKTYPAMDNSRIQIPAPFLELQPYMQSYKFAQFAEQRPYSLIPDEHGYPTEGARTDSLRVGDHVLWKGPDSELSFAVIFDFRRSEILLSSPTAAPVGSTVTPGAPSNSPNEAPVDRVIIRSPEHPHYSGKAKENKLYLPSWEAFIELPNPEIGKTGKFVTTNIFDKYYDETTSIAAKHQILDSLINRHKLKKSMKLIKDKKTDPGIFPKVSFLKDKRIPNVDKHRKYEEGDVIEIPLEEVICMRNVQRSQAVAKAVDSGETVYPVGAPDEECCRFLDDLPEDLNKSQSRKRPPSDSDLCEPFLLKPMSVKSTVKKLNRETTELNNFTHCTVTSKPKEKEDPRVDGGHLIRLILPDHQMFHLPPEMRDDLEEAIVTNWDHYSLGVVAAGKLPCPLCPPKFVPDPNTKNTYIAFEAENGNIDVSNTRDIRSIRWKDVMCTKNKMVHAAFVRHNEVAKHVSLFQGVVVMKPGNSPTIDQLFHYYGVQKALAQFDLPYSDFQCLADDNDPVPLRTKLLQLWTGAKVFFDFAARPRSNPDAVLKSFIEYFGNVLGKNKDMQKEVLRHCDEYWHDVEQRLLKADLRHLIECESTPYYAWNAVHLWLLEGYRFKKQMPLFDNLLHQGVLLRDIIRTHQLKHATAAIDEFSRKKGLTTDMCITGSTTDMCITDPTTDMCMKDSTTDNKPHNSTQSRII